jgi:hypothetical protein
VKEIKPDKLDTAFRYETSVILGHAHDECPITFRDRDVCLAAPVFVEVVERIDLAEWQRGRRRDHLLSYTRVSGKPKAPNILRK